MGYKSGIPSSAPSLPIRTLDQVHPVQTHPPPHKPFCPADLAGSLDSRMMASKVIYVLILGPCGYVTSCGQEDFADVILRLEMIL